MKSLADAGSTVEEYNFVLAFKYSGVHFEKVVSTKNIQDTDGLRNAVVEFKILVTLGKHSHLKLRTSLWNIIS